MLLPKERQVEQMTKICFTQTVTGQERKTIAAIIAQAINETPKYAGPPSFGFTAGDWSINKAYQIVSPELDMDGLPSVRTVIRALFSAGLNAKGALKVTVYGDNENEAKILGSVIKSKETLLKKSLQTAELLTTEHVDGNVVLPFFPAALDSDRVSAYLTLAMILAGFAQALKYSSATEKPVDNEKYALRCFLLRLGFIGAEYKTERKVLLAALEGNTVFKSMPAAVEVDAE
jgi:hypothetical protein